MFTMPSSISERGRNDALPAPQPHRVFGSHPQRAVPSRNALPLIKVRCAIQAASPSSREPIASVLRSPGRRLSGFGSTASGPPKKSLRDFATLANLGHFALRSA